MAKIEIPQAEKKEEEPETPKKEKAGVRVTKSSTVPSPRSGRESGAPESPTGASEEPPLALGGKKKKGLGFPLFDDLASLVKGK